MMDNIPQVVKDYWAPMIFFAAIGVLIFKDKILGLFRKKKKMPQTPRPAVQESVFDDLYDSVEGMQYKLDKINTELESINQEGFDMQEEYKKLQEDYIAYTKKIKLEHEQRLKSLRSKIDEAKLRYDAKKKQSEMIEDMIKFNKSVNEEIQ